MKKYKCVSIKAISIRHDFDDRFQSLLDEYSRNGWTLHSFEYYTDIRCTVVFEKDLGEVI